MWRTTEPVAVAGEAPAPPAAAALTVGPNPSSGAATVTLTLPAPSEVTVAVVDALGRAVAVVLVGAIASGAHPATLDTAALAPGVYVVRATAPDGRTLATVPLTVVH